MSRSDESIWTDLADHARLPFEEARMLPSPAYTSPEVLRHEHRRIFGAEWICVGRTADLPARGDYLTTTIPSADGEQRSTQLPIRMAAGTAR